MSRLGIAAHLLGIGPRDWDTMTGEETEHYLTWIDQWLEKNSEEGD